VHHQIELVTKLVAVVIALGVLARWLRVPYPILLAVAGLLLGVQDGADEFRLDPDLVFLGFLPPLLYGAAFNTHWPAFRAQLRAITLLAVGLTLFTTVLVAWAAHEWAEMSWPAGFVLGAVVSPPDAVAAVAVTRRVRVPRVISTLLEGESLVNDATALTALRLAVAVSLGREIGTGQAVGEFLWVSGGGVAVGLAGAMAVVRLHGWLSRTHLGDPKINIAITLLTPYLLYLPAERLHVSGVLAVVAAGLWVGSRCRWVFPHELYVEAKAVWEMVEFLLNGLVFILIGLQLPVVLNALNDRHTLGDLCQHALVVSAVVIAARMVWMFPGAYLPRWCDRLLTGHGDPYPPWQSVVVMGWAGMRGVVSLAAALAVPTAVPDRDQIQFLTFWVIFATLVGQGLTLPVLIRWLGVANLADRETLAEPPAEEAVSPTESG
jgi:Na+/H+ antiporter